MIEEQRTIAVDGGEIGLEVVRPDGDGPFPVVVFFHHGPGFDPGSKEAMRLLAGAGYLVAAPDRYWRFEPWLFLDMAKARAEGRDSPTAKRFFEIFAGTTDDMVAADRDAVIEHLRGDPAARVDRIGTIGYCIGARSAVLAMADRPDLVAAAVALHPSLCTTDQPDSPHLRVPALTGGVYVGFGSEDRSQPVDANGPFIDAVRALDDGVVEIHEGADHGFGVPDTAGYHEAAATRSYEMALDLYARTLT